MSTRIVASIRPSAHVHLGHWVGFLRELVQQQQHADTYLIISDGQALTTGRLAASQLPGRVREITRDLLAAGVDPAHTTIFVQSRIPEIIELMCLLSPWIPVYALSENQALKQERQELGLKELTLGYLGYPVMMAAETLMCSPTPPQPGHDLRVLIGSNQLPNLKVVALAARSFNRTYLPLFPEPTPLVSDHPSLPGLFGQTRMGVRYDNAIFLDDSPGKLHAKLSALFASMEGREDGPARLERVVTQYLKALVPDFDDVVEMDSPESMEYWRMRVQQILDELITPFRQRREELGARPGTIDAILAEGNRKARSNARKLMESVRDAMGIAGPPTAA